MASHISKYWKNAFASVAGTVVTAVVFRLLQTHHVNVCVAGGIVGLLATLLAFACPNPAIIAAAIATGTSVGINAVLLTFGPEAVMAPGIAGAIAATAFAAVTAGVRDGTGGWVAAVICGAESLALVGVMTLPETLRISALIGSLMVIPVAGIAEIVVSRRSSPVAS